MAVVPALAVVTFAPRAAHACGGCFAPPTENTVVTDHRMVLSISKDETTLYDQIRYSGDPSSFAWVLPIRGIADVGVSADLVFQTIAQNTETSVVPPPRNCPAPPACRSPRPCTTYADASARSPGAFGPPMADAGSAPNEVQVLKQETVGPYETVQLAATNPQALNDWLDDHGYAIPAEVEPMLAQYVADGFGFLALRLAPGAGIRSMKPVRVTTKGATPSLPLRMVAAGSGVSVGLTLWVIAEGRWEPQTFPSFAIQSNELVWTWASSTSNFETLRSKRVAELGGAAWEIESSVDLASNIVISTIDQFVSSTMPATVALPDGGVGPFTVYDPVTEEDGGTVSQAELAGIDMEALFHGRPVSRVTRMRSDLPRASLATDLVLSASNDQGVISNFRAITVESDEPQCSVYAGCTYSGTAGRSEARAKAGASCGRETSDAFCAPANQPVPVAVSCDDEDGVNGANGANGSGGCSVLTTSSTDNAAPIGIAGFLGLMIIASRRNSRRRTLR